MPKQISLDDSSYDEIYEKAMETLHRQAPWWTHTEAADPGITFLEMWALLADMQSYYLNQIQESHYRKYLKLLGIRPDEGVCAWAWIFFELGKEAQEECILPVGTKLLADRMVFETEEEARLVRNRLVDFRLTFGGNQAGVMNLRRKTRFMLREDGKDRKLFSFGLENALHPGSEFGFFILLDERGRRNRAEKGFFMALLAWEYEIQNRWYEAEVVRDDTAGLLYSGLIRLKMGGPEAQNGEIRQIRCRIKKGAYDVMPVLYKICLNVVRAIQKDTVCCVEELEFAEDCHRTALKSYLARTGRLRFFKRTGQGGENQEAGELWEDITAEVDVEEPVRAGHMERWVSYEGLGQIKALCIAGGILPEDLKSRVTGVAAQRISLPWEMVLPASVELMIRQNGAYGKRYRLYRREDPEEDRYSNAWHWEDEEIVLGDGRHGDIPPPSEDGLLLTSLALWEGEKGNVSIGRITTWERPELFPDIACENRLAGREGRNPRTPSAQFQEVSEKLVRQNRMVTEKDIQTLAVETPGLMIRRAEAKWKNQGIVVKIFPSFPLKEGYCVERYKSLVKEYLDVYRLAGTEIRIEIVKETERKAQ